MHSPDFEIAIIGGGLGGLTMAIYLAKKGRSVILFEKEKYPFHKVCGEYISNESKPYLLALGVDLSALMVPNIDTVCITSIKGKRLESQLDLGGFGVSRYTLDAQLAELARKVGVVVMDNCKVTAVDYNNEQFTIGYKNVTLTAKSVAGAFGKRSNLDVKLKRAFIEKKPHAQNNFIGVKYHVKSPDFVANKIELHNFESGYCGMSKVEGDLHCLCYLSTAKMLRLHGNSIKALEKNVLYKNPFLAQRFEQSQHVFSAPVTISQVGFKAKSTVENHVLMVGDAAGSIAPLCGNGMSLSMHAGYIAAQNILLFLDKKLTQQQLEDAYTKQWQQHFRARIQAGYYLQHLFGKNAPTEIALGVLGKMPAVVAQLVKFTHGKDFFVS